MTTIEYNTAERRIAAAKQAIMTHPEHCAWAPLVMLGKTEVQDNFPTAMTDGLNEVYGRAFVQGLNRKELIFVILHETMHKAFRHLVTWRPLFDENPRLANAACDFVINYMLVNLDPTEQFMAMPKKDGKRIGLYDDRFKGMNAKQVFDILKKENPPQGSGGHGQGGDGDEDSDDGDGNGGGDDPLKGFDEHDWKGAKKYSEAEQREIGKQVEEAIRQGRAAQQKIAGKAGKGDLDLAIDDLLTPKVPFDEVLREFVRETTRGNDLSTWSRPNRRYIGQDIILPSTYSETVGEIALGIDTSGSIGRDELTLAMTEVVHLFNVMPPRRTHLMYWDTAVAGYETYEADGYEGILDSTSPKGGGGTNASCVPRYMTKHGIKPACAIVFTDGYVCDWGKWDCPVLWVIFSNLNCTPPFGKVYHI
jgi:predicted metal-dependent peptidase